MLTQDYLNQIGYLEFKIQCKRDDILNLRTMAENITVALGEERVQSSGPKDRIANIVCKIGDEETKLANMLDKYNDIKNQIIEQVEQIEGIKGIVLYKYFINNRNFNQIADDMNFSRRSVIRFKKEGVKDFESLFGDLYKDL